MQAHDASAVQFLPGALIKANPDCDLAEELERMAVVITLEQAPGEEQMSVAIDAGRIPPYTISTNVTLVSIAEEAKRRGHPDPFFEHPLDRQRRRICGDLIVTLMFEPGGRIFTKRILSNGPMMPLTTWKMLQKSSKDPLVQSKGPWIDHLVYAANMRIGGERDEERDLPVRGVQAVVELKREEFMKDGIGRVHLKPTHVRLPEDRDDDSAVPTPNLGQEHLNPTAPTHPGDRESDSAAPPPNLSETEVHVPSLWDSCIVS
ncbi:hypothetical protein DFH09DRAFT_332742 [Mycena vulgaris]|nr:hypothetical protein DFH09DRAFT_332742 [Mycena vulgaris]